MACSVCHQSGHDKRKHSNPLFGFLGGGQDRGFRKAARSAEDAYNRRLRSAKGEFDRHAKRRPKTAQRLYDEHIARAQRIRKSALRNAEKRYG